MLICPPVGFGDRLAIPPRYRPLAMVISGGRRRPIAVLRSAGRDYLGRGVSVDLAELRPQRAARSRDRDRHRTARLLSELPRRRDDAAAVDAWARAGGRDAVPRPGDRGGSDVGYAQPASA